jgi:hypothetical protein
MKIKSVKRTAEYQSPAFAGSNYFATCFPSTKSAGLFSAVRYADEKTKGVYFGLRRPMCGSPLTFRVSSTISVGAVPYERA